MLLLVVGLVVLVLVIVVVVFLSVRSMHVEDDGRYGVSTARRDTGGRYSDERDSGARRPVGGAANGRAMNGRGVNGSTSNGMASNGMASNGMASSGSARRGPAAAAPPAAWASSSQPGPAPQTGQPAPAGRRGPAGDAQPATGGRVPGMRRGGRDRDEQRAPALPRPRGYQHDQDGEGQGSGDWGGVSDEQYWAELSSDRPLTTTARSAQAGPSAGRTAAAAPTQQLRPGAGDTPRFGDPQAGDTRFGGQQFGGPEFGGPEFGGPQFGGNGKQFRDPSAPGETDPGRDGVWGTAQDAPTAAWRPADALNPAAGQPAEPLRPDWAPADAGRHGDPSHGDPSYGDSNHSDSNHSDSNHSDSNHGDPGGDWRADEPSTDRWAAGDAAEDDPLSSDAFSLPGARARRTGGQPGYDDEPYGGGHRGSGGGYQPGELEPLPEPAGRAADWHSAAVPADGGFAADQDGHRWDDNGGGYDSGHNGYPAADPRDGYAGSGSAWEPAGADRDYPGGAGGDRADRGQPHWADPEPGYGSANGYHQDQGYGQREPAGYGEPDGHAEAGPHRGHEQDYDADFPHTGAFDLSAYDALGEGFGERAGNGQQPRHGYGPR